MTSPIPPHPLRSDPAFPRLKEHVIAATGLAYYADRDNDFALRASERLEILELGGCAAYLALLSDAARGEAELDALIECLIIGETFFFRHQELFDALRDVVVPDLLARNRQTRRLRVWSAGCSVGAEPYSVSILLRHHFGQELAGWDVTILGTDINPAFLHRAREACFEEWALRNTPAEMRKAFFQPAGRRWQLNAAYREGVSFQYHDLVSQHFPSLWNNLAAFDLILCRNVTLYFDTAIVRRLAGRLHESIVEGGWLCVGHADPNAEIFRAFRTVNTGGAVLYQKCAEHAPGTACSVDLSPRYTPPPDIAAIRALADRGEWDAALERCATAQAQDRLNPVVYFYHALVLEQTGRHDEAERALRQALYFDRQFVLAHYHLGLLLQKQRQFAAAARSFENVQQLIERTRPAAVFAEGDGITADALAKLTQMHLEALEAV